MIVLDPRNLIFEKAFFNCCNGIVKNNPYSINNRNGVIRFSAYCSMMFTCPNKRPKLTANNIIKVCSLSNTPIKNSILLKYMKSNYYKVYYNYISIAFFSFINLTWNQNK